MIFTLSVNGVTITIDDTPAILAAVADVKAALIAHDHNLEALMSEKQEKLDQLEGTMQTVDEKLDLLVTDFRALLVEMRESQDDPEELQALITKGEGMIAKIDAARAPEPEPGT